MIHQSDSVLLVLHLIAGGVDHRHEQKLEKEVEKRAQSAAMVVAIPSRTVRVLIDQREKEDIENDAGSLKNIH